MSRWIVGVDEVGRGPLAGPVVAAAVVLHPDRLIDGLADSKRLTERRREQLYDQICADAHGWCIGEASVEEIDTHNILQASLLAMRRAVDGLGFLPDHALVDGNRDPCLGCGTTLVTKGDATEPAISAASILAKVARDRAMAVLDAQYPGFGLAQHKGYPTAAHLNALTALGVTPIHRRSFAPVRNAMDRGQLRLIG